MRYQGSGEDYITKSFIIYSYSLPNIIWMIKSKRLRRAKNLARTGTEEVYTCFGGENWKRRSLGRPRHRRNININIDFQAEGGGNMDWTVLAQDRDRCWTLVNAVMNRRIP